MIRPPGSSSLTSLSKWLEGTKATAGLSGAVHRFQESTETWRGGQEGEDKGCVDELRLHRLHFIALLQLIHSPCYSPYLNVLALSFFLSSHCWFLCRTSWFVNYTWPYIQTEQPSALCNTLEMEHFSEW